VIESWASVIARSLAAYSARGEAAGYDGRRCS
jgi:hypothetical protein